MSIAATLGARLDRRRSARGIAAALLVHSAVPACLTAQWQSSVGLGSAVQAHGEAPLRGAPVHATARLTYVGDRLAFDGSGRWIGGAEPSGDVEQVGRFSARVQTGAMRGWRFVAVPSGDATRLSDRVRRTRLSVAGGLAWERGDLAFRATGGRSAVTIGTTSERTENLAIEVNRRVGPAAFTLTSRGTRWRDSSYTQADTVYYVAGFPFTGTTTRASERSRGYVDTELSAQWWLRFVQLRAAAGVRGAAESGFAGRWGGISLWAPVTARVALLAEVRTDPGTPEMRLPDRRMAALGLQVLGSPFRATRPRRAKRNGADDARIEVTVDPGGQRSIVISNLRGKRVELMGDLTNWSPVRLEPYGQRWRAALPVVPGVHHVLVRVDGGPWFAPPSLPTLHHEFGTVGVLLVEG